LMFHLPAAVSCSPNVRLYQTDSSYVTFGDIYDLHCEHRGLTREEPIIFVAEKIQNILREYRQQFSKKQVGNTHSLVSICSMLFQPSKVEYITAKKDACDEVALKMVPDDVLSNVRHNHMFHFVQVRLITHWSIWPVVWMVQMSSGGCGNNSLCRSPLRVSWHTPSVCQADNLVGSRFQDELVLLPWLSYCQVVSTLYSPWCFTNPR
jgi:hypothetical protein